MSDTTGTNADRFSITREGVKTGLVSIPLKYMHTPNEVISIRDIENTSVLVAEYIRRLG
jgi:endoglucanase